MKAFSASQLSHNRREILNAARDGGAIIQSKNTNGVVLEEFVIVTALKYKGIEDDVEIYMNKTGECLHT